MLFFVFFSIVNPSFDFSRREIFLAHCCTLIALGPVLLLTAGVMRSLGKKFKLVDFRQFWQTSWWHLHSGSGEGLGVFHARDSSTTWLHVIPIKLSRRWSDSFQMWSKLLSFGFHVFDLLVLKIVSNMSSTWSLKCKMRCYLHAFLLCIFFTFLSVLYVYSQLASPEDSGVNGRGVPGKSSHDTGSILRKKPGLAGRRHRDALDR